MQVSGRGWRSGILGHRAWIDTIVTPTTTTAATARRQCNTACRCHAAQHPRPDWGITVRVIDVARNQGISGGDRLITLHRERIVNPPQGTVFIQHQLVVVDEVVFQRHGFAVGHSDEQIAVAAGIAGDITSAGLKLHHGIFAQYDLVSFCYRLLMRQSGDDSEFTHVYYSQQSERNAVCLNSFVLSRF